MFILLFRKSDIYLCLSYLLELELDLAEKHLAKRKERKKDYKDRCDDLITKSHRKWFMQKGKPDRLGFMDE